LRKVVKKEGKVRNLITVEEKKNVIWRCIFEKKYELIFVS